jgi:hypothetical protein
MGKRIVNRTKKILGVLLVVSFIISVTATAISAVEADHSKSNTGNKGLQLFSTEQLAKQHCPTDIVVWLNLPTGIYHFKGQRLYGNTIYGAYVCQKEAGQTGYQAAWGE